jgi:competence protein ComEC
LRRGFAVAGLRAHVVAEPVLGWRYYGPVEGRIVAMDRSSSDALRLTLDRVRLPMSRPQNAGAGARLAARGSERAIRRRRG